MVELEPFPDKKYKTILADCPWQYGMKQVCGAWKNKRGQLIDGGCESKYPTMSIEELCAMPVQDIADDNCILFFWTTSPMMRDAYKIMEAWGFTFKSVIYWVKTGCLGMGFWFRHQVEPCFFGIMGKVPAFKSSIPNVITAKRREHSRKPDQLYTIIERFEEYQPRIELFSRHRRQNWDVWGSEVPDGTQMLMKNYGEL